MMTVAAADLGNLQKDLIRTFDADTTGLLLFSRDGELTHRLLHPKYLVEREYLAEVEGPIDRAVLTRKLADGAFSYDWGVTTDS